jgi:hypothetical protein
VGAAVSINVTATKPAYLAQKLLYFFLEINILHMKPPVNSTSTPDVHIEPKHLAHDNNN